MQFTEVSWIKCIYCTCPDSQWIEIYKLEKIYELFVKQGYHHITYMRVLGDCNVVLTLCGFTGLFILLSLLPFSKTRKCLMQSLTHNSLEIKTFLEAVAQRCSAKKVFIEVLLNSQENNCARVSFLIKLQASNYVARRKLIY